MATAYVGLFMAAFGAATLLPLQSEAALVGLLASDRYWLWGLLAAATVGNVLGSLVNWWLGRRLERFQGRRWFPVSPRHMERARAHYRRYGHWSLLLSWVPVIGDPLTLVAGVMREPLARFLAIVTVAKGARYGVLALLTLGWTG
ncbi:YqaA family protein [Pseudomonas sp. NPDC089534]|uniref:YqaA family protein n=1 Tax=Pseudomonas sp. NPDC089534 TaxID=3364468 RepID=UPI0038290216